MARDAERLYDTIFAAILGNLLALDTTAPVGTVTDTGRILRELDDCADKLAEQDIGWDDQAGMVAILRGSARRYRHFDSGAQRKAFAIADALDQDLRFRVHHSVCQVIGIAPDPASGLQNLKNARQVLVDATRVLQKLFPVGAANLAPTIKKYDAAIDTLVKKSTAATVVRKNPAAKKAVL